MCLLLGKAALCQGQEFGKWSMCWISGPTCPFNWTPTCSIHPVQLFPGALITGACLAGDIHVCDYHLAYSTVDPWTIQIWTLWVTYTQISFSVNIQSSLCIPGFHIHGFKQLHVKNSILVLWLGICKCQGWTSYMWIFNCTPNPGVVQGSTVTCITGVNVPEICSPSMPCGEGPGLITVLDVFSAYLAQWLKHILTTIAIIYCVPTNYHNNPVWGKYHCSHSSDKKTSSGRLLCPRHHN